MRILVAALVASSALNGAALADDREIKEFRIAILGGASARERAADNECLRARVEQALGVETRLLTPADYDGAINGLLGRTIDAAWLGAASYARIHLMKPDAVEPVLVRTDLDGSHAHHAIGISRKDSGITSLADMKGKVVGFGDPKATTGYLIPAVEIPRATGGTMVPGDFFVAVEFTGGYAQTIDAVIAGEVDGGVIWADGLGAWEDGFNGGALRKAVDTERVDMGDLVEIWRSAPIPDGPVVLRKALPAEVKEKVIAVYASLIDRDRECAFSVAAGQTGGFEPIGHDAYLSIIAAQELKSD